MSLNYARELLKISISQLCNSIGFDTTSEIVIDILVDVCERQFQYLSKEISNIIQLNNHYQPNYFDLLFILLENKNENLYQLEDFMKQFKLLHFSKDIIRFPYQKKNQFYLRIPFKDSQQILQRDQNQTTEYIYDWLPLFPDQETPEQPSTINHDINIDLNNYYEQDKRIDKNVSHHPLTLSSFLSKNGDETNIIPIGKRPNRSLPSILYRPRRIIEFEAAAAAAEKAKKEQVEKENNDKDQQQGSQPPLRLTIPKPSLNNDKTPLPLKKLTITTTIDGINKKISNPPLINTNSPSVNLGKKIVISPTINHTNETHSQTNPSTNLSDLSTNLEKNEDLILDLTKQKPLIPSVNKLPTLKLNIKNVSNPQITNNSETPITATKKFQKQTTNTKLSTTSHQKVNLKIRTSSLPLFETTSQIPSMISPTSFLPNEFPIPSIESSININDQKQTNDIIQTNNNLDQTLSQNQQQNKNKKHKKHHQDTEQKKIKKETDKDSIQQMDIDNNYNNSNTNQANGGGTIRLKIKLGKPSLTTNSSDDISSSTINDDNTHRPNPDLKTNPIRLTLPIGPSTSTPILTHPTINRTPHRRKSGKIKHLPQKTNLNPMNISSFGEDNTISIDDLPLGERTSPNKINFNQIQTNLSQQTISTSIKNKLITNKKKIISKRQNNILGVAVIEERRVRNFVSEQTIRDLRIHNDSQEKIWICPSCNRPDNGQEAMIACDLCDDWYHWECVGIVEEPPESIPWFCPKCHRSNSSTSSSQGIKPSSSSKAKRKRATALYQQKKEEDYSLI